MAISKEKRKQLAHFLAGFIVLIKAVDKADHGHFTAGAILGLIGVAILAMTFFHHRLAQYVRNFDALVFLAEALVLGIVSWLYFHDGKTGLPVAYALASVVYLVVALVHFRRGKTSHILETGNELPS